jgi:hypothetical protein
VRGRAGHAPADHLPDALGDPERLDRNTGAPATLAALDGAGLGQMAQHLAHEERVALGLLVDGLSQQQLLIGQGVAGRLLH